MGASLPALAFREIARACEEPRDVAALARTCRTAANACADRLEALRVVPARGSTYVLHANGRCDVTPKDEPRLRLSGVVRVTKTMWGAFAALTRSGTVVAWGHPEYGGDSAAVQHLLVDVASVTATGYAFAALTRCGTVVNWGRYGGDSSAVQHLLVDVVSVTAAQNGAFAALTRAGTVVTWGIPECGGDSSDVQHLLVDVASVTATDSAFAALTRSGTVVAWGWPDYGGDSSAVQHLLVDVVSVTATKFAFAALTRSGAVVTWGGRQLVIKDTS